MNHYEFFSCDQRWDNWLVYAYHDTDPPLRVRERYENLTCAHCFCFDHDAAYARGFEPNYRVRAAGDLFQSDDGFLCVNNKVLKLLKTHRVGGFRTKPLGNGRWHVLKITKRVSCDKTSYERDEFCPICGRAVSVGGVLEFARRVNGPNKGPTFFTTQFEPQGRYRNRAILVTEQIVELFKKHGIKGGTFSKLLSSEEEKKLNESIAKRKERWPPHTRIIL